MNTEKDVVDLAKHMELQRAVTLTIFYNAEASASRKRTTGFAHSNVISPNFIIFPVQVDTLETEGLEQMRALWLKSRKEQALKTPVRPETRQEKFARLLSGTMRVDSRHSGGLEEAFIRAARYPVPSQYQMLLPEHSKDLRRDIIDTLVPFRETHARLLRLEEELELPMRSAIIAHTRLRAEDELKASMRLG